MAQLHFNYLDHIIKGLKGKLSTEVIDQTIEQLEVLIEEDKNKVKEKLSSRIIAPGEVRN